MAYKFTNKHEIDVKKETVRNYILYSQNKLKLFSISLNMSQRTWLMNCTYKGKAYQFSYLKYHLPTEKPNKQKDLNKRLDEFEKLIDVAFSLYLDDILTLEHQISYNIDTIINDYINYKIANDLRESSIVFYKSYLKKIKLLINNDLDNFVSLTFTDVQILIDKYSNKKKWSNVATNHLILTMKDLLNFIDINNTKYKIKRLDINKYRYIKLKPVPKETLRFSPFSDDDFTLIKDYLNKRNDDSLYLAFRLIYDCHIRPNELRQIKIKHFNFNNNTINISSDICKNKKNRTIQLSQFTIDLIKELINIKSNNELYIFGKNGQFGNIKQVGKNFLAYKFKKMKKLLNIDNEHYSLYSMKHMANIIKYVEHNYTLYQLKHLNGHSSLEMTERYLKNLNLITDINVTPINIF